MTKRMLVVRASDDVKNCEIEFLNPLGEILDFAVDGVIDLERDKVAAALTAIREDAYDYLYLCGHGDKWALSGNMNSQQVAASWPHLSNAVCQALKPNALVIVGCCDGGLRTIAYDFLVSCDNMRHIFGLAGSVLPQELMLAMHTILGGMSDDLVDGATAASRATHAIGRRVSHDDGDDLRYSVDYSNYEYQERLFKYQDMPDPELVLDEDDIVLEWLGLRPIKTADELQSRDRPPKVDHPRKRESVPTPDQVIP